MAEDRLIDVRKGPGTGRVTFPGISSRAYEHPAALTALTAMRGIRGFDLVLRKIHGAVGEPVVRMQYLSSAVRVGPRQFRRLHAIKEEAVEILDLPDEPELYVRSMGAVNALTVGMDRPFVVISTELLDIMNDDEVRFVLGHELGHAFSGHSLYQTMARLLAGVGVSAFPLAGLAVEAVEAALQDWSRKAELSSDRAGLLVAQDVETSIRALMKLAAGAQVDEMDASEFLEQAAEYELDATGVRNRIYKFLMPASSTHPILVVRAAELDRWVRRGEYDRILQHGEYALRAEDRDVKVTQSLREQWGAAKQARAQRRSDVDRREQGLPAQRGSGTDGD